MFADHRLNELNSAQADVVSKGQTLRRNLMVDVTWLQNRFHSVSGIATHLSPAKPLLVAGVAAVSFLAFRNLRRALRWAPVAIGAWKFGAQIFNRTKPQ